MADLVLGLAKSAVEGTLTAAKSAIEEEEKLKKSMRRNLVLISDEFEMMHSFLSVAKEPDPDDMVRTLVRQVRDMALDVEDCIETVVLVDIKSHRWWRRLVPSFMLAYPPAAALDQAVAAAELLMSRIEAMGQRNERYWNIRDSGSKPTERTNRQVVAHAAARGMLKEARDTKKKHDSPRDLVELINKIDHVLPLQVISVWGAVDNHGVASIIKKTCDHLEISKKFLYRAWVKLTHPFNPHEFIRSLLAQFYTNYYCPQEGSDDVESLEPVDVMTATQGELKEEFMKRVSDQRYLVFLEDVPSAVDWEAVRVYLPDKKNGSCVVVHTQQLEVASLCVGESHRVLELEQYSDDHSVCVFFNEPRSPRNLIELINEKDYALPLQVISVLGQSGDLGLESIMKKTCNDDPEMCKRFRCRACVKLMSPFDPNEFIRCLLAQLHSNYCPLHGSAINYLHLNSMTTGAEGVLIEFVKQVMSNQRYLVFLEDVSSTDDWKAVREFLPDENNGSCIVVHTQQHEVANLCVGQSHRLMNLQFSGGHSVPTCLNEYMDEDVERAIKMEDAKKWLDESQLVGRQADIWFLEANISELVQQSIYGIAGVGKSYMVRYFYCKQVIAQNRPFQKFGWVDVSHPFNLSGFSWDLLLDLHSGSLQPGSILRIRDPVQECRKLLQKHTCLIVIDGLRSTEDWESIKDALFFENKQSRIIVIANEKSVATYCSKCCWNVQGLESDDALELFLKTVSREKIETSSWPSDPSPDVMEEVKSILTKCGGLPKLIVAIAEFIADGWGFWVFDENFMWILENHSAFGSLRNMFAWVRSYFHSCPDSLKPCIFYLSNFPSNHIIRRRRLVRRWIAEGYSRDNKERTAEKDGEKSFVDLCDLNMIQVPGSTSMTYIARMPLCQVNGFIREYIISRPMEENLVFALEGHCSVNSQHTGRHLSIGRTWDRDKNVYESIDFSRLRSLTVFGKWESFFISDRMSLLRVLDLEDTSSVTDGDLKLIVRLLPHLKFLSLRGSKEITHLPNSFGGLRQLQTLDIRDTSVFKLPRSITKLKKLQHVRAGTTVPLNDETRIVEDIPAPEAGSASPSTLPMSRPRADTLVSRLWLPPASHNGGVKVPLGIGKMIALHNISVIDVSTERGRAILKELKDLTQLHKLGVSGINRENSKELCSAITGHPHLESLSVWLDKNQAGCLDAISPPPEELRSLKLNGCVDKLPPWIKLLPNLNKLKLHVDMIAQDEVDLLMFLPCLQTLCLHSTDFKHGELRFRGPFRSLLVLEIDCNCRLQSVTFQKSSSDMKVMQELEVLKIRCHNVSSLKFCGLQELRDLKEVSLNGSYDDKVKQDLQKQIDELPMEIKPNLRCVRINSVSGINGANNN